MSPDLADQRSQEKSLYSKVIPPLGSLTRDTSGFSQLPQPQMAAIDATADRNIHGINLSSPNQKYFNMLFLLTCVVAQNCICGSMYDHHFAPHRRAASANRRLVPVWPALSPMPATPVHIVDLDSNRTVSRWFQDEKTRPAAIAISTPDPQNLTEHIQDITRRLAPDLILIDVAGSYERALTVAAARAHLTLIRPVSRRPTFMKRPRPRTTSSRFSRRSAASHCSAWC